MYSHEDVARLRMEADDRERWMMERIDELHNERDEARAMVSAAVKEMSELEKQVAALQREQTRDVDMAEAAEVFKKGLPNTKNGSDMSDDSRNDKGKGPGKRGKARKGSLRAGLPTCSTAPLPYAQMPLFKRKGWKCIDDLKRAIAGLKLAPGEQPTSQQLSVSGYQARDAMLVFSMIDPPWKEGCLVSFLSFMKSRNFENTHARDRKHWMCMKLWPGRFSTPQEYRQHKACMSKAGKFVTSINKLKRLYERDLVERGLVNDKSVA